DHRGSKEDWQRSRELINRLGEMASLPAFAKLRDVLDSKIGIRRSNSLSFARSAVPSAPTNRSSPRGFAPSVSEYLLGVAAECDFDDSPGSQSQSATPRLELRPTTDALDAETRMCVRGNAARALEHYRKLLEIRPDSYWGHYRAAGASYVLGS